MKKFYRGNIKNKFLALTGHLIFTCLMLFSLTVFAEIRESKSINEIVPFINQQTVVVFDLDNTLLTANQMLGTDQFFGYMLKKASQQGLSGQQAVDWALLQVTPIQPRSPVHAVESMTPEVISQLQKQGVVVLALTARPPTWASDTVNQVSSLGVDFSMTAPILNSDEQLEFGLLKQGIYFVKSGGDKGQALLEYLNKAHITPSELIFIDDKFKNVQSVNQALKDAQFVNINFRYGAADAYVEKFNESLAECEYQYFLKNHNFLSDDDARAGICN